MKKSMLIAVSIVILSTSISQATVIPILGNASDGLVENGGTINSGQPLMAGSTSPLTTIRSGIAVFALPAIPAGESITSADLQLGLYSNSAPGGGPNVDLYAIRRSASSSILTTDYFTGAFDTDGGATGIMDDFVTPSSAVADYQTDATADQVLAAWLQSEYDGGAVAGEFVFLRVSVDSAPTSTFDLYRFNDSGNSQSQAVPLLTITSEAPAVPEPNTFGLFALAGLVGVRLRRRRRLQNQITSSATI